MPAARVTTCGAGRIAGSEQFLVLDDAGIWREFALDLVTESKAHFAGAEAGADAAIRIVLAGQAELDQRLHYEPLREQQLVLHLDARRGVSRRPDERRGLDLH